MIVKIHNVQEGKKLVAICDSELLGKKIEHGDLQLDLASDFYKGEEKSPEEVEDIIKGAYLINVVGDESIAFCIKIGVIDKGHVLKVGDIPHAQTVVVRG